MGTVNMNLDEQLWPRNERAWMHSKWAIHPRACRWCEGRQVIACGSCEGRPQPVWTVACPACAPISTWVHGWTKGGLVHGPRAVDGHPLRLIAVEPVAIAGATGLGLELHIAATFRPRPALLTYIGQSFEGLWDARAAWARRPPKQEFALERDAQGVLWAPRDPSQAWPHEGGRRVQLGTTTLRKARMCFGCRKPIPAGATCHRPNAGPGCCWDREGREARWCWACTSAVPVHVPPEPEAGTPHGPLRVHESDAP
jgi:hypothetical protein